jgi:predicted NBD/HSP70 family sugar kinase
MQSDRPPAAIAVFDLGGTWFRWGRYSPHQGLLHCQRAPAINYLSRPDLSAAELQRALTDFVLHRTRELLVAGQPEPRVASISVGAPVNAKDRTVLGSGPLWGPTAGPLALEKTLSEEMPELQWHVMNDVTALLAPYMHGPSPWRKTLLITVSSGIGSRLYDHRAGRIPYDGTYGVQGEIGHLTLTFELDDKVVHRQCECGGWNHLNAFASGRGMAQILRSLPALSPDFSKLSAASIELWQRVDDDYRLNAFRRELEEGNSVASGLLEALVTPLSRTLAAALSLDPEIDRIVMTGGVVHGLGKHYREALQRTFVRDGLYQISKHDPHYLERRLFWEEADDFSGLRGAGLYAEKATRTPTGAWSQQ